MVDIPPRDEKMKPVKQERSHTDHADTPVLQALDADGEMWSASDFRDTIYSHYALHGRDLPWRNSPGPYGVYVSEIMLQQTQVDRVIPKYGSFMERFPGFSGLAAAPLEEVLREWKGLGYNRRALALHRAAGIIVSEWNGALPADPASLEKLPGIGRATAASICAYAFNLPVVFIETNIRAVFIHFFFGNSDIVSDREIYHLAEKALDRDNPSRWYNALMDYGVMLKREYGNPARKSRAYRKQPKFQGSNRQFRGRILEHILSRGAINEADLAELYGNDAGRAGRVVGELMAEGFIAREEGGRYRIANRQQTEEGDTPICGKN
jgi:A/G-specific adenine glycosylase